VYRLTQQQVDHILHDIKERGIETEPVQQNILDHVCCIIEEKLEEDGDFESCYKETIATFFHKELREIEIETKLLLTFKNYYAMKNLTIISGAALSVFFLAGSFFKIMYWPGASVLLVLAMLILSFVFMPLLFILKSREAININQKLVVAGGTIAAALYCISVLLTVTHWVDAWSGLHWYVTVAFSMFIFIPLYFFNGIRKPEARLNTIVASILLIAATALQFTMLNTRPSDPSVKVYSYMQNESLLEKMQRSLKTSSVAGSEQEKYAGEIHKSL
jgi:cation transport ATPase